MVWLSSRREARCQSVIPLRTKGLENRGRDAPAQTDKTKPRVLSMVISRCWPLSFPGGFNPVVPSPCWLFCCILASCERNSRCWITQLLCCTASIMSGYANRRTLPEIHQVNDYPAPYGCRWDRCQSPNKPHVLYRSKAPPPFVSRNRTLHSEVTPATPSLVQGTPINKLSLDVSIEILLDLDLSTLRLLRAVSRHFRALVDWLPEYRLLRTVAPAALAAAWYTGAAAWLTVRALHTELVQPRCRVCRDRSVMGAFLFLPTGARVCERCLARADALQLVPLHMAAEYYALSPRRVRRAGLPVVRSPPGEYGHPGHAYAVGRAADIVAAEHLARLAVAEYGSAEGARHAVEQRLARLAANSNAKSAKNRSSICDDAGGNRQCSLPADTTASVSTIGPSAAPRVTPPTAPGAAAPTATATATAAAPSSSSSLLSSSSSIHSPSLPSRPPRRPRDPGDRPNRTKWFVTKMRFRASTHLPFWDRCQQRAEPGLYCSACRYFWLQQEPRIKCWDTPIWWDRRAAFTLDGIREHFRTCPSIAALVAAGGCYKPGSFRKLAAGIAGMGEDFFVPEMGELGG